MPSINLLPQNFKSERKQREESTALSLTSIFLIIITILICLGIYFKKETVSGELNLLSMKTEEVEAKIEKEVDKNETLLMESRARSVKKVLSQHPYLSQAVEMIQGKLVDGIYLDDLELSPGKDEHDKTASLKIGVVARDYGAVIEQVSKWKSSFWIESVEISEISASKEGKITFSTNFKIKKELVLHHEPYWNYGLSLLDSKANRHLKINDYNAVLEKKTARKSESKIKISFSGTAYNKEALVLFKDNLNNDSLMKDVFVSYDLSEKDNFGRIEFNGSAVTDYDHDNSGKE